MNSMGKSGSKGQTCGDTYNNEDAGNDQLRPPELWRPDHLLC